jgi:hypothetical protein
MSSARFAFALVAFTAALSTLAAVPPAGAETARGCLGELRIFDRARDDIQKQWELLATFEGRGTCKNKLHANDCRKRAADGIIRCAREMWDTRNGGTLPASCTQERGNSFARTKLEGINPALFRPQSVLDRARFAACCKFNRVASQVPTNLWVVVIGDTGCISKKSSLKFDEQGGSWHTVDKSATLQCAAVRGRC